MFHTIMMSVPKLKIMSMSDGPKFFIERTLLGREGFGNVYPDSENVITLVIRIHQVEPLLL